MKTSNHEQERLEKYIYKQEWLERYTGRQSFWKHPRFYNIEKLFDKPVKNFEKTISVDNKQYSGDMWKLDYVLCLVEAVKLHFIRVSDAERVLKCMRSPMIGNEEYALAFFRAEHTQKVFEILAENTLYVQKKKKMIQFNHANWIESWGYYATPQKHCFLNINELFSLRQADYTKVFYFNGDAFLIDLWLLDYIISLQRAERKQVITKQAFNTILELLLSKDKSNISLGLSLIREPVFYRTLKSI